MATRLPSILHVCLWRHLPPCNQSHVSHWNRLGHQTQEKAAETPNLQPSQQSTKPTPGPPSLRTPSPPPAPPSLRSSSPSAPPYFDGPSQLQGLWTQTRSLFFKRECFLSLSEDDLGVIENCLLGTDTPNKNKIKNKNPFQGQWVTDPGQSCRHQLVLHFEMRVIPSLMTKNPFLRVYHLLFTNICTANTVILGKQ